MCASVWFDFLVDCLNIKTCGIWMGNVASNMQVLIENIRSIGLEDIT